MASVITPPLIGFGTYNRFVNANEMATSVRIAIKVGYRHFDLAKLYENEAEIGAAINAAIADRDVSRADLFICTKLWNTDHDDPEQACRECLKRLSLDYIDNYMMHWPCQWTKESYRKSDGFVFEDIHRCDRNALNKTWAIMERLVELGLARSISVSNFNTTLLKNLLSDCRIPPISNEMEVHPYLQEKELISFCRSNNILVVCYCPLGKGNYFDEGENLLDNPTLQQIAQRIGKSPGQVCLRWGIQRGTAGTSN